MYRHSYPNGSDLTSVSRQRSRHGSGSLNYGNHSARNGARAHRSRSLDPSAHRRHRESDSYPQSYYNYNHSRAYGAHGHHNSSMWYHWRNPLQDFNFQQVNLVMRRTHITIITALGTTLATSCLSPKETSRPSRVHTIGTSLTLT